ncbi:hypothetical protein RclHR1_04000013 [Rhizophagus clarus]|uniref:U4/U6.U5 small nuclear ribonucleoprotein 27kDa protein domain-containing protein n=1 Tax=Rhizophagus clarus TaxID=94130 RepID=A0A2Z6RWM2_9GLOM|nr:hypothetical protein RclHR1_04000013 [Rhizophagus clarus]
MPRSPSPSRPEYSRRHHSRSDYRDRESHYRDRDYHPDGYRDLDRPEDYHDRRRSRSPLGRDRDRDRDKYDRRERRSRSPHGRDRDRIRDRDRRDRRRTPERSSRHRSRSRSPISKRDRGSPRGSERERDRKDDRHDRDRKIRSRSRSPRKEDLSNVPESSNSSLMNIDPDEDPEHALMKAMGIAGFNTTKGKKVAGNDAAAVSIKKQRQYRQYMNRRGGFNRPLDKIQ